MTSKIIVNNLESDAGINTITVNSDMNVNNIKVNTGQIGIGTDNPDHAFHLYSGNLGIGKSEVDGYELNLTNNNISFSRDSKSYINQLGTGTISVRLGSSYTEVAEFTSDGLKLPSGKGIDFSATSDATGMTSEFLDDYEEGTWTPTVISAGSIGTPQYTCTYTKIGRLVTVNADIHALSDTTSSTKVQIGGMPYVPSTTGGEWCTVCMGERYNSTLIVAYLQNDSGWKIKFRTGVGSGNYADLTHAAINDNGTDNNLRFTLTYEVL